MRQLAVIGMMPGKDLAQFVRELRARYPGAAITAVVGAFEPGLEGVADEYVRWDELSARALIGELRRRRFDLLAVAYNADYAYTRTYWKALFLALVAPTQGVLLCEGARLPDPVPLKAPGRARALASELLTFAQVVILPPLRRGVREGAIVAVSLPLVLVLLGMLAVDLMDAVLDLVLPARRFCNQARQTG